MKLPTSEILRNATPLSTISGAGLSRLKTGPERNSPITPVRTPSSMATARDWPAARLASSYSLAPVARPTRAMVPVATPIMNGLRRNRTVAAMPTAARASLPRKWPTQNMSIKFWTFASKPATSIGVASVPMAPMMLPSVRSPRLTTVSSQPVVGRPMMLRPGAGPHN